MLTNIIPKTKLKKIRNSKNLSQEEFSEMVFMNQSQYNRREKGKITISDDEWFRFANALEVDIEEIKESDYPLPTITHNHGENDNSINGYEITIKFPKNFIDGFHQKLDTLIELLQK